MLCGPSSIQDGTRQQPILPEINVKLCQVDYRVTYVELGKLVLERNAEKHPVIAMKFACGSRFCPQ